MADIKKLTDDAIEYIRNLFSDNSDGHDFDHSMRVYANAVRIAGHHEDSDILIVSMAALLHDADDYKFLIQRIMKMPEGFCARNLFPRTKSTGYAK